MVKKRKKTARLPSHKGNSSIVMGVVVSLFVLFLLGGGGYLYFGMSPEKVDAETFCPANLNSVTAILIDATDPPSVPQRQAIINRINEVKKNMPRYARIDIYALGNRDADGLTTRVFSFCNPGFTRNLLTEKVTPERMAEVKAIWENFSQNLDNTVVKFLNSNATNESPLLEGIREVALQSFDSINSSNAESKELIIVSDMIENTKNYSQYRQIPSNINFEELKKLPFFKTVAISELSGIKIKLLYILRKHELSGSEEHIEFWEDYFKSVGASTTVGAKL